MVFWSWYPRPHENILAKKQLRDLFDKLNLAVHWKVDFRIPNCHGIVLELVCGADLWCNRHYRTSPVVLEGFCGQVWPKISRKPEKSEHRSANEPINDTKPYKFIGFGPIEVTKPYEFIGFGRPKSGPSDPPGHLGQFWGAGSSPALGAGGGGSWRRRSSLGVGVSSATLSSGRCA